MIMSLCAATERDRCRDRLGERMISTGAGDELELEELERE